MRTARSGELDIAILAAADGFPERFQRRNALSRTFPRCICVRHRFEAMDVVPLPAANGETYLLRANCEYDGRFSDLLSDCGAGVKVAYVSEREDWIQNMVAGGLGICFIPEFSAVVPGLVSRPIGDPEVWRDICFVSMSGRRHSPAVSSFLKAVRRHDWPAGNYPQASAA